MFDFYVLWYCFQVRSILLRGFDRQMSDMIGDYMENEGVKFVRECVPTKIELIEEGKPGRYKVNQSPVFSFINLNFSKAIFMTSIYIFAFQKSVNFFFH